MAADIVNNENYPMESSPLITLRGRALNGETKESPRTPKSHEKRFNNFRNSPRRSTPNSPKISRLPIRSGANARFSIKDLRLPLDESVTNFGNAVRVTPEKLMEELRDEVKKKKKNDKLEGPARVIDEEISLSVSNCILEQVLTSETDGLSLTSRPRMSMRNRQAVMVDAPDLIYEDPLEVARQTLANTRANTGYKQSKLIYTTERRSRMTRSNSPEPAFSKKTGIGRHFLNFEEGEGAETEAEAEEEEEGIKRTLKFDRLLKLFESNETETETEKEDAVEFNFEMKPKRSCLKLSKQQPIPSNSHPQSTTQTQTQIVQIKRICYEGEEEMGANEICSPTKRRRIENGAKRLNKID